MRTWSKTRVLVAALAVLSAALTGAIGPLLGGPAWPGATRVTYVLLVVGALHVPAAILLQVIAGQLLVAALLGRGGADLLVATSSIAGVIVTAELLSAAARLDSPVGTESKGDLGRAGLSALIGGGLFAVTILLSGLPGPNGLAAVALASAALVALAILLVRQRPTG